MLPDNLGHLFDAPLRLAPSSPALFQDDVRLTYAELDTRCNRVATGLARLGVGAGARVALMFSNDFRFLESLFGPMRLGAVTVPLNTRMGDDALRYVVEDAEATVLIANRGMAERARAMATAVPRLKHVIVDARPDAGLIAYDELPWLFELLQRLLVLVLSRMQRLLRLPRLQRRSRGHGRLPWVLRLLGLLLLAVQRLLRLGVQRLQLHGIIRRAAASGRNVPRRSRRPAGHANGRGRHDGRRSSSCLYAAERCGAQGGRRSAAQDA